MKSLFEADLHVVAKVRAAPRPWAPPATAESRPEDRLEDIANISEIGIAVRTPGTAAVLEGSVTIAIIGSAFLRVFQAIIGDADRLELGFTLAAAGIAVRMMLHREFAIGALDRSAIRIAADPK